MQGEESKLAPEMGSRFTLVKRRMEMMGTYGTIIKGRQLKSMFRGCGLNILA